MRRRASPAPVVHFINAYAFATAAVLLVLLNTRFRPDARPALPDKGRAVRLRQALYP